ncbi:MAG: endolytic transglycosylase MltG [Candidatus Magasanikbacteria bacterium]|nr:endolytic transglycosylase MltG [Candidatus Magasanikbacteria bacterium]
MIRKWLFFFVVLVIIGSGYYAYDQKQQAAERARLAALQNKREEITLRLIEGWTVDEIATYVEEKSDISAIDSKALIGASVDRLPMAASWRDKYSFLKNVPANRSLEGYLYPDTYRVWKDQMPKALFDKQLAEFEQKFGDTVIGSQSAPLKTLDDIVILASIVEAEVTANTDRSIVAGIFLNRLRIGMALQTDASLSYLHGSNRAQATAADLASDSLYNTYKHPGLPPGPVGNPGEASIKAVLNPTKTDYFYFLTDKNGKVYYAKTLAEHAANRAKAGI